MTPAQMVRAKLPGLLRLAAYLGVRCRRRYEPESEFKTRLIHGILRHRKYKQSYLPSDERTRP